MKPPGRHLKQPLTGKKRFEIKTSEVRQSFLEYFKKYDHRIVPSSPVIPYDDPTLLFTNAGMNQFKDIFTGQRKVDYKRAASTQKCIRAGGKHNDLDNVGFTARHHTFFEMLGNFSFGDYFKEEAIFYGWEWVTKVLKLPPDKLYATVYDTDDEAFTLWVKIAPELKNGRIRKFGKKDNYWSMGEIGPCGPCSEIHFDRGEKFGTGPNDILNGETDRFMEIWNLVFMQYDQQSDGNIVPLPKPSVDTGAGLERISAIMQNASTNYEIDIFQHIINDLINITHSKYEKNISSHHVIADHIRALTFAIADGAGISNEGQGYVLRRILRRAARHGRLLGMEKPFIHKLVASVVDQMGEAFPEIKENQKHIENVILAEEESFGRTLETGLELFDKIVKSTKGKVIAGEDVFKLYDTYGFPFDLTEIMATEKGMTLDMTGFEKAMELQREKSKNFVKESEIDRIFRSTRGPRTINIEKIIDSQTHSKNSIRLSHGANLLKSLPSSEFVRLKNKDLNKTFKTKVLYHNLEVQCSDSDEPKFIVIEKTPFYVKAGGQVSDIGWLSTPNGKFKFLVTDTQFFAQSIIHIGRIENGEYEYDDYPSYDNDKDNDIIAEIDADRRWDIMRNHTVTHLAHAALRKVLGSHIKQGGSYVGPDRMRFDFSHQVEEIVNNEILKGTSVRTDVMDLEEAKATGAMALFGEKYEDTVRVVSVGNFSKELCGGTHVDNINQIGPFFITLETGVASGVRRLEAITGRTAISYMLENKKFKEDASKIIGRSEDAITGLEQLREQNLNLQRELKKVKTDMFSGGNQTVGNEKTIGAIKFVTHNFDKTDHDIMGGWVDTQKVRQEPVVAMALGIVNGKFTYMASASHSAVKKFKVDIGKVSKTLLSQFDGRGGGKANFARGTVGVEINATDFFKTAETFLEKMGD